MKSNGEHIAFSGFYHGATKKCMSSEAEHIILPMPFIDLQPTDDTCIYSLLCYIQESHRKMNLPRVPIVTFDQQLWWKAMLVSKKANLEVVILLGGFHTRMSFLGAIGYIMANSGIEQILATVYAENTTTHIMRGKAYKRAVRAHTLLSTALKEVLLEQIPEEALLTDIELASFVEDLHESDMGVLGRAEPPQKAYDLFDEFNRIKQIVSESSVLNKYFVQYVVMIDVLLLNIQGERAGNWCDYITSLTEMLPYLVAAGRRNYVKSIAWFLEVRRSDSRAARGWGICDKTCRWCSKWNIARLRDRNRTDGGLERARWSDERQRNG